MKLTFMTLGCPSWDLDTICAKGREYGFDGVDFRGVQDELDITTSRLFTTDLAQSKGKLVDAGLEVSCISSSIVVCDPDKRQANMDEAVRTIALARELNCRIVRVFGGGDVATIGHAAAANIGSDCMNAILELHGARELLWVFETHDHWIKARDARLLLDHIADPAFATLWDVGHTARIGSETPDQSYAAIGPRIGYTHIKDAVYDPQHEHAMADGWRYVLHGCGELPLAQAIALLRRNGYDGWIQCESEKRWHPEVPDPEELFPHFVQWVKPLIA